MNNICQELLLSSLTEYYEENSENKLILKDIINGKHLLSLRMIDWLVTHYSRTSNIFYWTHKEKKEIYSSYPDNIKEEDSHKIKKVNLYLDYRAQLKSYAKINFDSFRRHNRISFIIDNNTNDFIETTIGQLNFFRWAFNNNVIKFAVDNYEKIHQNMSDNNSYNSIKDKKIKNKHKNIQEITKANCTLRFD